MTATDWVVVTESGQGDRVVPIAGRLLVGRKLGGVGSAQQVLLDDPLISRAHLELRVDDGGDVLLVDQSTNGTRVNGRAAERGEPLALRDGDLIEAGSARLGYRSLANAQRIPEAVRAAVRMTEPTLIACVAGDVVGYAALSEGDGGQAAAAARDALFAALAELLSAHGATAKSTVGDSVFAAWDASVDPAAVEHAVGFALAADALVAAPLSVGWAVTVGDAREAHTSTTCRAVHGDAINLALRLSGLAARDGRAAVLVSAEAAGAAPAAAAYGDVREIDVRGRPEPARVQAAAPPAA